MNKTKNKKLIVGNWKMNPNTLEECKKIIKMYRRESRRVNNIDIVACPPLPFIPACISRTDKSISLGAQTLSQYESGAHTGEVSASIVKEIGCEYVILGHSEQRTSGETNSMVSKKIQMALSAGLTPIVCVGESVRDEAGNYMNTLRDQIKSSFADLSKKDAKVIVIAYEPVWAIGAKEAMSPAIVYEMLLFIKKVFADLFGPELALKLKILYGGSVNFRNAADIVSIGQVDGLLVGRESINMSGFGDLLKVVDMLG